MNTVTVYYHNRNGKKERIQYHGVRAIQAGPAVDILGKADCIGNGVPLGAPLIMLRLDDGNTATFDALDACMLLS